MSTITYLAPSGAWSLRELRALQEIHHVFYEQGLLTDCAHGVTDEGAPWTVFYDVQNGQSVAHVARDRRNYILIRPDRHSVRAPDLGNIVEVVRGEFAQSGLRNRT